MKMNNHFLLNCLLKAKLLRKINCMKKYKTLDLPYGGKLYYVKNRLTKATMVKLQFLCGAREDNIPGLAHFTEHMFFTGTKEKDKKQISKQYFDFIDANAFTNSREICFVGTIFTNEFSSYLDTVAEMITKTTFSQRNIDTEIPVVQQEIAKSKDKYNRLAGEFNSYNLLKDDVFKNRVLGNEKSVASIKSKDVKNYVKKFFVANNLIAYVSSPMCANKVKKLLSRFAQNIPHKVEFTQLPMVYVDLKDDGFFKIETHDIKKSYLFLNFAFNHNYLEIDYKTKCAVVQSMINDFTDGIQKQMRLEKGLVYGCGFSTEYYLTQAVSTLYTECEKGNINEIIKTTADYLKDKLKEGFTQAELDKYKREWKYGEAVKEPRAARYMNNLFALALYGKLRKKKYIDKIINNLSLDECNAIFRDVFASPRVSLTIYGDATTKDVMSKTEFKKLFKF